MKIRSDFVTNSSSSSFVIAYKRDSEREAQMVEDYPEAKVFIKIVDQLFDGKVYKSSEELLEYYADDWLCLRREATEKDLEEDGLLEEFNRAKEAFNDGYVVTFVEIEYEDGKGYNMIEMLKEEGVIKVLRDWS